MAAVRGALVGLAVTVTACSIVSLDGYSGGARADDSPPIDGAPIDDGGSPGKAETAVGEAGALGWCATNAPSARLCADFDDQGIAQFGEQSRDNGTLEVDTREARSAPASLLATAGSRRGVVHTYVATLGAESASRAKVAFDLRVEGTHPSSGAEIAHLMFRTPSSHYTVGFGVLSKASAAYAYEYGENPFVYEERPTPKAFPLETWVRITLTADLPAKTVTLERDDDPATLTAPIVAPLAPPLELELELGIAYSPSGENGWKVRIDNVVFDAD